MCPPELLLEYLLYNVDIGRVALLSHFDKVLALSKFALLKCKNEVNPIAWIPWATNNAQIEIEQC